MNSESMFQTATHCADLTVHYFSSRALAQTGPQVIGVTSAFVKLGLLPDYVQLDAVPIALSVLQVLVWSHKDPSSPCYESISQHLTVFKLQSSQHFHL